MIMVDFIETPEFPESVSEGASGGPTFNTHIFVSNTGEEQRAVGWTRPIHKYRVELGVRTTADMDTVRAMFFAVRGKAIGFRYKDWNDYKLTSGTIGTGNGTTTTFQIKKTYTTGALTYTRNITKPVSGTVVVTVNAIPKVETTDYTVDYTTGVITFLSAPGNTHAIVVSCEFHVPVRLNNDNIEAVMSGFETEDWPSIELEEDLTQDTAPAVNTFGTTAFIEDRFPSSVSYDTAAGAGFKTHLFRGYSGIEIRQLTWDVARQKIRVVQNDIDLADMNTIRAFFYNARGQARGFRFKDWADYTFTDEQIGTGDGTNLVFRMKKSYGAGSGSTYERRLFKPVNGTITVKVNSITKTPVTHYNIDYTTGVITFTGGNAPGNTHPVTITGEFDIAVRFDTDALDAAMGVHEMESWQDIPIVELLLSD